MPTNPTINDKIHEIDIRLTTLEVKSESRHEAIMDAIKSSEDRRNIQLEKVIREVHLPAVAPKSEEQIKSWKFALAPGTAKELALAALAISSLVGGPAIGAYFGSEMSDAKPDEKPTITVPVQEQE